MDMKATFVATLLGCTMLAGCDGSDNQAKTTPAASGTYGAVTAEPNAPATPVGVSKADLDALKHENAAALTSVSVVQDAKFDLLKQDSAMALEALETKHATELDALKQENAAALASLDAKYAAAIETNKQETATALKAHEAKIANEFDTDRRANAAALASLDTKHATELEALKQADATAQAALDAKYVADLDALKQGNAAALAALDTKHAAELEALKTDFTARLAALNKALDFLRPRTDVPLTQFVNLFVGTTDSNSGSGHSGNVNPGAQTPFGMVSFGPDTRGSGAGYGSGSGGYYYPDSAIQFFSLTHLNGPGCRGQGAVAMLPADTASQSLSSGAAYVHTNETAEPGYYKVKLNNNITTELTATTRTGMMKLTYADPAKAFLIMNTRLNNGNKSGVNSSFVDIKIGSDGKSISGNSVANPFCDGTWAQPVYFYATFDKPLKPTSAIDASGDIATLQFDLTAADPAVQLRVGISSVSTDNAKLNLDTENAKLAFADIKKQSSDNWNHRLNTIQLDLGKLGEIDKLATPALQTAAIDNLKKFYTAFYRVFSGPTVYSDVNGEYRSMKQVDLAASGGSLPTRATENVANYKFNVDGKASGYTTHYSGFSMWDTYRSSAQLVALVAPNEASEMMQSLVADAQQCGAFPHWVDGSEDTIPMQGDHALNVIAGSYAFGARNFDLDKARSFVRQSTFDPTSHCNDKLSVGRNSNLPALPAYLRQGYIATDGQERWHASSATVEMVTSDRSAAAFLSKLPTAGADQSDIDKLSARAKNWTNIFDDRVGQMRLSAKNSAGAWQSGVFHEGSEAHYLWAFAHDWTALIGKLGGKAAAITRLNTIFAFDNSNPFNGKEPTPQNLNSGESGSTFYIGNEPSFQTPWAYNWAGAPKYGQYVIPLIMRKNYSLAPGGLPGNDDMGATSAWYVLASLGLYPVIPSESGLAVSTPQFSGITLWLGNGKKLRIEADKQAMLDDVRYISEMKLNDVAYQGSWLPLEKIANGGTLSYKLSANPTEWGAGDALTPPSGPNADYSRATATPPAVQLIQ